MYFCGTYPAEIYGEEFLNMQFMGNSAFAVFLVVSLIFVALYFLSWILSKKQKIGWMIFALIFFAVDTVVMLLFLGIQTEGIIDIVFHVWVIISLIMGLSASSKLKNMHSETNDEELVEQADNAENSPNSVPLRMADLDVKSRTLLEAQAIGHTVTYRRVKKTNQLIIDLNVYDEVEIFVECAHSLKARIDGHLIEVGFDGVSQSYLRVDGQVVAKKLRLF